LSLTAVECRLFSFSGFQMEVTLLARRHLAKSGDIQSVGGVISI
jgi:hypothetical protein